MHPETICYCFNFTVSDLEEDFRTHGRSTILEKLLAAREAGACRCAEMNRKERDVQATSAVPWTPSNHGRSDPPSE